MSSASSSGNAGTVLLEDAQSDSSDIQDVEAILGSLHRICANVEKLTDSSFRRFRTISKRAKQEVTPLRLHTLQAKPAAEPWLKKRKLAVKPTFRDFFECLINEHAKEHRLDLTSRSIRLNADAATLLGLPVDTSLSFFDLMRHLPQAFH